MRTALGRQLLDLWTQLRAAPPPAFDWRIYLSRYPDLRKAGIDNRRKAIVHWARYGAGEGRAGGKGDPTGEGLVCSSVNSVFLRATGALVCWDNAGSDTVLQPFDTSVDYGKDVCLGEPFNAVRRRLAAGQLPFDVCRRCIVLRSRTSNSPPDLRGRVLDVFQVEPSYKCTLDCPGCVPLDLRNLSPPRDLEPEKLRKILRDLVRSRILVKAFDFQGLGEPLLNPALWQLVQIARDAYPTAFLTLTTNAHGVVRDELLDSGIDEIICAIDGVDQSTFAPYRVHGRFALAYRFMTDAKRLSSARGRPIRVLWKYVLFDHNDAPEHLERAQILAREAGIDELVFVFTRSGPRSRRVQHPSQIAVLPGDVRVTFRHYEPDLDDLFRRLEDAREALDRGHTAAASDLVHSVATQLHLFFPEPAPDNSERAILHTHLDALLRQLGHPP